MLAPFDPIATDFHQTKLPPSWMAGGDARHLLGTDRVGRDLLSRLIWGCRLAVLIGLAAGLAEGIVGLSVILLGGLMGRWAMRAVAALRLWVPIALAALLAVPAIGDVLVALPVVALTPSLMLALPSSLVLFGLAATVRPSLRKLRAVDFAMGSQYRIRRDVLLVLARPLVVVAIIEMALAVLIEAYLTPLGLGLRPPMPSWGMLIGEAQFHPHTQWEIVLPGAALCVLVLGLVLLAVGVSPDARSLHGSRYAAAFD